MSPSPENPITGKGVHGMSADPKGDFPKHPVLNTGTDVLHPPIPFPKTSAPDGISTETGRLRRLTEEDRERIAREVKVQERKALITRAVLILSTLAATGLAVKHDVNNFTNERLFGPRIVEDITSIPQEGWNMAAPAIEDIQRLLGKKETIPPVFDAKADKQVIKAGVNAVPATEKQIRDIVSGSSPSIDIQKGKIPTIPMLIPISFNDSDYLETSIFYQDNVRNIATNELGRFPITKKIIIPSRNTELSTPVIPGVDKMELLQLEPYILNGKSYFSGTRVKLNMKNGDVLFVTIRGSGDVRDLVPMDIIKDAPIFHARDDIRKLEGLLMKPNTPTIKTNRPNVKITIEVGGYTSVTPEGTIFMPEFIVTDSGQVLYPPR